MVPDLPGVVEEAIRLLDGVMRETHDQTGRGTPPSRPLQVTFRTAEAIVNSPDVRYAVRQRRSGTTVELVIERLNEIVSQARKANNITPTVTVNTSTIYEVLKKRNDLDQVEQDLHQLFRQVEFEIGVKNGKLPRLPFPVHLGNWLSKSGEIRQKMRLGYSRSMVQAVMSQMFQQITAAERGRYLLPEISIDTAALKNASKSDPRPGRRRADTTSSGSSGATVTPVYWQRRKVT